MPNYVIKRNNKKENYDPQKISKILRNLKVDERKISSILKEVESSLPETVTTKDISKLLYKILERYNPNAAYRFNLKEALARLGPTGYPFEKFIAHLFKNYGYETKHNVYIQGKCLKHEVDFIAKKESIFIGECKFHSLIGKKNDLKTILYSYGRFLDIKNNSEEDYKLLVVTNTKFTTEALNFSLCYDIQLLSWDYPERGNLRFLIENSKNYPLTIFNFLSFKTLQNFFKYDLVLITDLLEKDIKYLKKISGLDEKDLNDLKDRIKEILKE